MVEIIQAATCENNNIIDAVIFDYVTGWKKCENVYEKNTAICFEILNS